MVQSSGGIWRTIDGGRNWKAMSDQTYSLAIGDLIMDPKNPDILYAGTGEGNLIEFMHKSFYSIGVLKTKNRGKTWELKGEATFKGARFFRLAVNPENTRTIFAATTKGVFRTLDGGDEWMHMTHGLPPITDSVKAASDLVIDPKNHNIVFVAFWADGIYRTEDANEPNPNWIKISNKITAPDAPDIGRIGLAISKTNSNILYTLISSSGKDKIIKYFYMSEDGGANWNKIDFPPIRIYNNNYDQIVQAGLVGMGAQGSYNLNIIVDPDDSNIVYLCGQPLLKAIRDPRSKKWRYIDIGRTIHTDNHAIAFHPSDNQIIFAGNDGGVYKSTDGGFTWDDTLNEGLCIAQFTFMDQHPCSDAIMIGGTQDNGTLQFRNNSVFYLCDEGDGGCVAIDPQNPDTVFNERFGPTIKRSDEGGRFGLYENGGSWKQLCQNTGNAFGVIGSTSLFQPPFTLDQTNSNKIALGTHRIYLLDQSVNEWNEQKPKKWDDIKIQEDPPSDLISAIKYVNSNLIYAGTDKGKIYLVEKTNSGIDKWKPYELESNNNVGLPPGYVSQIAIYREDKGTENRTIIVTLAGLVREEYQSRVWRGIISDDKKVEWRDISGNQTNNTSLPNSPVNAVAIDFHSPGTIYVGTDIGVFKTSDGGESWRPFGIGLPKSAVQDMRLLYYKDDNNKMRLLRVVTHGRGIWEVELDERSNKNQIDLYVRDHIMDTGRFTPSLSGPSLSGGIKSSYDDKLRNIKYFTNDDKKYNLKFDNDYDYLFWWMCADIKVDTPFYQMDIDDVDYVKFEYRIKNKNPIAGLNNHVYVQVHNRGTREAGNVFIKLLYAQVMNGVSDDRTKPFEPKLPDIPKNFWTDFFNKSADLGQWKQIGDIKILPHKPKTLTNIEPTVLCWIWKTPKKWEALLDANGPIVGRVGLLVVIDSMEYSIPEKIKKNEKFFNIEELVRNEKHIGVRILPVDRNKI